jgi:hypothetical protein
MGLAVPGPFDNSFFENFQFGFWLESLGTQVFWWEMKS